MMIAVYSDDNKAKQRKHFPLIREIIAKQKSAAICDICGTKKILRRLRRQPQKNLLMTKQYSRRFKEIGAEEIISVILRHPRDKNISR